MSEIRLKVNKNLYIRAKHVARGGIESEWSDVRNFSTKNYTIAKPKFKKQQTEYFTTKFASLALENFSGSEGQTATLIQYQLVRDKNEFNRTPQPFINEIEPTQINFIIIETIAPDSTLYVRFRYRSNLGIVSEWSDIKTLIGEKEVLSPIEFINVTQKPGTQYWEAEIRGGEPNWDLAFLQTTWLVSTDTNFTPGFSYGSNGGEGRGTITFVNTNTSSSSRNRLVQLETKGFLFNKTYHIRAAKSYEKTSPGSTVSITGGATVTIPEPTIYSPNITPNANVSYVTSETTYNNSLQIDARAVGINHNLYMTVAAVEWNIYLNGNIVKTVVQTDTASMGKLPLKQEYFNAIAEEQTYQVEARIKAKTSSLFQYPNGYEIYSAWSSRVSFRLSLKV